MHLVTVLSTLFIVSVANPSWVSFEISQTEEQNFDTFMPSNDISSSHFSSASKKFRVAIVTAGALRSFAYAEKSWHRYILGPWKDHVRVFAHVVGAKNCIFSQKALQGLKNIATEFEVGFSSTPLIPLRVVQTKLPDELKTSTYFKGQAKGMSRGNFFDMHSRRIRAYELARDYAERNSFEWDMIVMLRLDTAFYSPVVPLGRIFYGLVNYITTTKRPSLYIPTPCNFYGVCDRMVFGLPREMDIYFQHDWFFDVLKWSVQPVESNSGLSIIGASEMQRIKDIMKTNGNAEHILKCWFVMNNITQVYSNRIKRVIAFMTLRTVTADGYCHLNRDDYLYKHPLKDKFIWEPDKMTAYPDHSTEFRAFDLEANPMERCGSIARLNATEICATKECSCGKYG